MPEFRDAGHDYSDTMPTGVKERKFFPRLTIDLRKFPELGKEIGSDFLFIAKARVTQKTLSEDDKSQEVEIRQLGVGYEELDNVAKPKNEADAILDSLQKTKRF